MNSVARLTDVPPTLAPLLPLPRPLLAYGGDSGRRKRRWLTGGVLLAHLAGGWALLQVDAVRRVVAQAAPVLMIDVITLPDRDSATPPTPSPQPRNQQPTPPPPVPVPVMPIAPSPAPAPTEFVMAVPAPEPAPPAPVLAVPSPAPAGVAPTPPAPPAVQTPPPPSPVMKKVPGSALRYLVQPRLNFPRLSVRAKESGEVVVRIVVDENGHLKAAWVQKSSGYARIDQAALQDIRSARFVPYIEDGRPIEVESSAVLAYDL